MLGSSLDSAVYAGRFGLAFSFAHFIAPQPAVAAMRRYRDEFKDEHLAAPYSSIGVFAIATEDPERADLFRKMREIQRIRRDQGIRGPPPTLEEAAAAPFSDEEMEQLRGRRSRQIIGSGAEVKAGIDALVEETQADEVIVLTITPSFADRVKSYELIADAYRESATPPPAPDRS